MTDLNLNSIPALNEAWGLCSVRDVAQNLYDLAD